MANPSRRREESSRETVRVAATPLHEKAEIARTCSREGQHHAHVVTHEELSHFATI